jgi:serine/threonine protein kinase
MMDEERLEDLLLRWEDLQDSGESVDVETLCRDCPELSAELRRRIEALRRVAWLGRRNGECPVDPEWYELRPGAEPVRGYRLVQRLGKGGFAEVWKAEGPQGPVALKFIAQTDDAARVERRSLAVIKHLEHPNLLRTYETWQVNGFFVVAMELADNTLMDRWRREQAAGGVGIPRDELLRYLREAAEGIDFLQKRYIQHRDIKPQNLFLVGDTLKVGDFGLMRLLAHSITGHSGCLTLFYAPPEFFEGKTTRQSDVYSLAVTYCQMRGGRLPFEGSAAAMVAAHLRRAPDLSMLPPAERPVVEKALSKRPDERWPTCRAFVEALTNPPKLLPRRALWPWLTACVLAVVVFAAFWLPRRTPPPSTESPAPLRAFEVPPLPPQARNLIRNVSVARMGEPFNGFVALSNGAGGLRLWDVATGKVIRDLGEPGGPGIALAPFENPLGLSGCDDASVILRDLRDGHEVRRYEGHTSSVSSVAFSSDGNQVLTGSCDSTVRLFDRLTGKEIHCLRGHKGIVMSVAFGPRDRLAISGGWDGTVRVWDLEKGKEITRFEGHTSKV